MRVMRMAPHHHHGPHYPPPRPWLLTVVLLVILPQLVDSTACSSDVMAYYNAGVHPLTGGVWKDIGPLAKDGAVVGSVAAGTGGGGHVAFSGGSVNTGLTMGDINAKTGAFSVAAWFQYTGTDTQTYSAIFGSRDPSGNDDWFVGKDNGNTMMGVQDGNYINNLVTAPGVFDAAGRASAHSVVWTRSAGAGSKTAKVYIDGVLKGTGSFTGANNAEELHVGKEYGGAFGFSGKMWQVLILSTELSAAQAASLHSTFNSGQPYCGVSTSSVPFSLPATCLTHPTDVSKTCT
eukprot:jgi/Bigna1/77655/fgenesh1_pg.49_\